jgi:hypothetical protein
VEQRLRVRVERDPLAHESVAGQVAAVAVDHQEAAEALRVQGVEEIPQHGDERLEPQRRAAGVGREVRREAVGERGQDQHAQRFRGLGRDALREDVVGLEREVPVLLRRPDRQRHAVVAREVLLDLHPVEVAGPHA